MVSFINIAQNHDASGDFTILSVLRPSIQGGKIREKPLFLSLQFHPEVERRPPIARFHLTQF